MGLEAGFNLRIAVKVKAAGWKYWSQNLDAGYNRRASAQEVMSGAGEGTVSESSRRKFLQNISLGLGTASMAGPALLLSKARSLAPIESEAGNSLPDVENPSAAIDCRYSPLSWQTAYCFPDDHYKSLIGEHGELRYGHPGQGAGIDYFPEVVEFSLLGMEANEVRGQRLEAPGVPIIHTRIDRPEAFLQLTTFATQRAGEGRVDNVILEVEPRTYTPCRRFR